MRCLITSQPAVTYRVVRLFSSFTCSPKTGTGRLQPTDTAKRELAIVLVVSAFSGANILRMVIALTSKSRDEALH